VRRDIPRRSSWCWYEQRHLPLIEQALSGNSGASFDRNRVSNSPIAAGQHAELLTIDTACHGLGGATGAIDRLAGGGVLSSIFHMNRLLHSRDRIVPAINVLPSRAANRPAILEKRI
jgi:hypothetical protein